MRVLIFSYYAKISYMRFCFFISFISFSFSSNKFDPKFMMQMGESEVAIEDIEIDPLFFEDAIFVFQYEYLANNSFYRINNLKGLVLNIDLHYRILNIKRFGSMENLVRNSSISIAPIFHLNNEFIFFRAGPIFKYDEQLKIDCFLSFSYIKKRHNFSVKFNIFQRAIFVGYSFLFYESDSSLNYIGGSLIFGGISSQNADNS